MQAWIRETRTWHLHASSGPEIYAEDDPNHQQQPIGSKMETACQKTLLLVNDEQERIQWVNTGQVPNGLVCIECLPLSM